MIGVEQVLERRQGRLGRRQSRLATASAFLLHGAVLAAVILVPKLRPEKPQPIKFITAQIVPLQALGRPDPPPPAVAPPPKAPPPPAVDPPPPPSAKAEPQPAPPPPPDPKIPTLVDPKAVRKPAPPAPLPAAPTPPVQAPIREGSEKGNARGTAAFGAAVAALDNPDFTYSYYIDRMVALIRSRWNRPSAAVGTETAVHFRILRDGSIVELELRSPSGDTLFDRAASRAVQDASPLPPLPVGYRQDSLGVSLIVR